jgi:putative oxidoreductase
VAGGMTRGIEWALRLTLGGVFLYTGLLHAADAPAFVIAIQHYKLVPADASMLLGVYLPWVEIMGAAGVLLRRLHLGALAALGGLLLVFLGAITSAWARGLDISCGCFREAVAIQTNFPQLVGGDLALLAIVVALFAIERRHAADL